MQPLHLSLSIAAIHVTLVIGLFVVVCYSSSDRFYDGTYQTVRMNSDQTLTGDTVANPRAIPNLPFSVTDGMARFSDNLNHPCGSATGGSSGTSGGASADMLFMLFIYFILVEKQGKTKGKKLSMQALDNGMLIWCRDSSSAEAVRHA